MSKRNRSIRRAAITALENLEQRRLLAAQVTINVHDTPYFGETLDIHGTTGKDQITVFDDPGNARFVVWVDKNHNGTATESEVTEINQSDYDEEINTVLVDSDKGDDTVNYYLVSTFEEPPITVTGAQGGDQIELPGVHRSIEIDLAAGKDSFLFYSPTEELDDVLANHVSPDPAGADVTNGSDINLEVEGQEGDDTITTDLSNTTVSESTFLINMDAAQNNDTVNFIAPTLVAEQIGVDPVTVGTDQVKGILQPTLVQVQVDLGSGNNTYNQTLATDVVGEAILKINVNGGSGKDVVNDLDVDIQIEFNSGVSVNANLGAGDDTYHGEFVFSNFGVPDRSSVLAYNVQAGDGNDNVKFDDFEGDTPPTGAHGPGTAPSAIEGLFDLQSYGGNGNDNLQIDFNEDEGLAPPIGVEGGTFRALLSGDYGNDKVRLDVAIAGESRGTYDIALLGGGGDDTMGARWFNPNDEIGTSFGEYGPRGGILVDGGRNNDKFDTEEIGFGASVFIVRACEKLVESLENPVD